MQMMGNILYRLGVVLRLLWAKKWMLLFPVVFRNHEKVWKLETDLRIVRKIHGNVRKYCISPKYGSVNVC